jgi:IS30 family transposase
MHRDGKSDAEIARQLGRHRKTIGAERKRNRAPWHLRGRQTVRERATAAHEMAVKRRTEWRKGRRGPLKLAAIRTRLCFELEQNKRSPEEIAKLLRQGDFPVKISGKTIRRWILKDARELQKHLPFRGRKRRNHLTPRKGQRRREPAPPKKSVHTRPRAATARLDAGHKEFDFITCSQSTTVILVGIDRKTRYPWLRKLPNREADTVKRALCSIEANICPPLRQTMTLDNDTGFQGVFELEHLLGLAAYFCDPYAAWQKGSVENLNQRIRRFIPKGTDLSLISEQQIQRIEQLLRSRPMDCLDNFSPAEQWTLAVRDAQQHLH